MIKAYVIERISWIMLFVFLQVLAIFVAFLDSEIPLSAILYYVFLSVIIFTIFLVVRYQKETKFYRSLEEREDNLDLTSLLTPKSPFEDVIEKSMIEQTKRLKEETTKNHLLLEQEKDDLLSWIHEVKTPLTAMHLMIDRLEDKVLKAHLTYEWLRIHLLLDQQLHQKRIPFIENDIYIEKTELESLIFKEIKTLQSWCIQKRIGFDVELEVTEVLSDSKWLAFLLRQLLTNAVKYSVASDISIRSYQKDRQIVLEVKNFGRGINPRDIPRIFDKGFTSTSAHHDNAATGMGLYLAKKVAHSLFIQINVYSTPGLETTFTLTFPNKNEFVNITVM